VDSRTANGLVEVLGRYGRPNNADEPTHTDGRPIPAEGVCGNWYRRYMQPDDGERGIYLDGLWPNERYCFAVNSSDPGGGVREPYPSILTVPVCETAPWNSVWGTPDAP